MTKMGMRLSKQEKIEKMRKRVKNRYYITKLTLNGETAPGDLSIDVPSRMKRECVTLSFKKPKRKPKLVPLPKLKRKLWKLISAYVRAKEPKCVSCGKGLNDQAGHYIKKSICNLIYQYEERNIHAQCLRCNLFLHGNPVEYRKWMVFKYGEEVVKSMETEYCKPLPPEFNPREYITNLIEHYEGLAGSR